MDHFKLLDERICNNSSADAEKVAEHSDSEINWSETRMKEAKQELKDQLRNLISRLELATVDNDRNSQMAILRDINELISDVDNKQYNTLDEKVIKFYEQMLDAALELDVHRIIFVKLQENSFVSAIQLGTKNESACEELLVDAENTDFIYICISILTAMASGNKEGLQRVNSLGIRSLTETLSLNRGNDFLGVLAFKLLSCFMSDDVPYADKICQEIKYHIRANELLENDGLCDSSKVWLIFFWDWALNSLETKSKLPTWIVRAGLSAAFTFLEKSEIIFQDRSIGLLRTIFEDEYILSLHSSHTSGGPQDILYCLVERSIPTLISLLAKPFNDFVLDVVDVLSLIFRSDNLYQYDCFNDKLLSVGISNGLMHHVVRLLQKDDFNVVFRLLFLITVISKYDEEVFFNLEGSYDIKHYLVFHMHSVELKVAAQALVCVYNLLSDPEDSLWSLMADYVANRPDVVAAIIKLLNKVSMLKRKNISDSEDDKDNLNIYLEVIADYGLRCMHLLIKRGLDKEEQERGCNRFVVILNTDKVIQLFSDFKAMDLNDLTPDYDRDFAAHLFEMFIDLKELFDSNNISYDSGIEIFQDLD